MGDRLIRQSVPRSMSRAAPWVLAGLLVVSACSPGEEGPSAAPRRWVEDATCAGCHGAEARSWTGSDHDLAMQVATSESVLGDFDSEFTHFGVTSTFSTSDGRFFVNTEGPDGDLEDFEIAYTFGFEPLQQYLIRLPGGRLQALGIAWDTGNETWFHLYPDEEIPPGDPLHWTGVYQNWNYMCAECHSTNLRKNYDPAARTYDTTWTQIDVGCQGCHGPGGDHVDRAREDRVDGENTGLAVDLSERSGGAGVEACAACHSRRRPVSLDDVPGEPFLDHFVPETLGEGIYHPDGQILEEVYVYGSFLQSRMYREGVVCADCHDPHSTGLRVEGNALCTGCHGQGAQARFPGLNDTDYDSPGHHFHPQGSTGAGCINCHMPERTYMVVDPRRDHSFRVPRPDLTVKLGTPNACTDCHADQTPEWASDAVAEWYGTERRREPHYGEILAAGRRSDPDAGGALSQLALDPGAAAIVRATAVDLLARYGSDALPALTAALEDPDGLVRVSAARAFGQLPAEDQLRRLPALLEDPLRAVRLEAARLLAQAPTDVLDREERTLLPQEVAEYEAVQTSMSDTPAANLNLGVLHTASGELDRAIRDYQTALDLQPDFAPASLNLATLLNQVGQSGEAFLVLRDAVARQPGEGELQYSMGLLLAEMGQMESAAESLGRSVELIPGRARMRYNHALALEQLDRRSEAEAEFLEANRLDPEDPSIIQALAVFYADDARWDEAIGRAEELVALLPGNASARQFLQSIRRDAASR